jgi:hypothetical protein
LKEQQAADAISLRAQQLKEQQEADAIFLRAQQLKEQQDADAISLRAQQLKEPQQEADQLAQLTGQQKGDPPPPPTRPGIADTKMSMHHLLPGYQTSSTTEDLPPPKESKSAAGAQQQDGPPLKKRRVTRRRGKVKLEPKPGEGQNARTTDVVGDDEDSDNEQDWDVEFVQQSANSARRILWQRGHAATVPSKVRELIQRATVTCMADALEPLRTQGFAILEDVTVAFAPKNGFTKEQRDFIEKGLTPAHRHSLSIQPNQCMYSNNVMN